MTNSQQARKGNARIGSVHDGGNNAGKNSGKDEILKEKYAEFRMAMAQIKQVQEQLEAVEQKKQELEEAEAGVSQLKQASKGTKMLAPVTDGIFVEAVLGNTDEVLINVGSNVCVKKTVEGASSILKAKQHELVSYQEMMLEELNKLTDSANRLEKEIGQLAGADGEQV